MPFAPPAPPLPPAAHVREESGWNWQRDFFWNPDLLYCDPTRHLVDSFKVGDAFYRVLRPLHATFEPAIIGRDGRFIVSGLEEGFIGRGKTLDDAEHDWMSSIDFAIQQLLATQDFERTVEQRRQWNLLSRNFDLNEIRYSRPLKIRAYGRLISNHSRRFKVRWIDGSNNTLTRDQVPQEIVGFRVNQPFEAVVQRNPRNWALIRIEAAFAAQSLPFVSAQEAKQLLRDVPLAGNLPELEWD